MNATKLWPGSEYAWYECRGRGGPLPLHARRVRVLEVIKRSVYGKKRDETLVKVMILDDEGNPNGVPDRTARARDILDFWEQYEEDRAPLLKERQEREERHRRDAEERQRKRDEQDAITSVARFIYGVTAAWNRREAERIAYEKLEKRKKHLIRLKNVLITKGLQAHNIHIDEYELRVPTHEIERWLGIDKPE